MTFLIEINVICNVVLTSRQKQFTDAGLDWIGRMIISEALFEFGENTDMKIILDSSFPKVTEAKIKDSTRGAEYSIIIHCRKLGEDNGKDQLVNISNYLINIRDYIRHTSRKPTSDELKRIKQIIATPMGSY